MKFAIYQESRRGGRRYNQDRVCYSYTRESLLIVVADGMGGHLHGEVAAQITIQLLADAFQKQAKTRLKDPSSFLFHAINNAHDAILNYASTHHLLETPRTTVVACILQDDFAYWAHVGDSRLYFFHGDRMIARTMDHSKVQQMVNEGLISEAEAEVHQEKNKIYNCLGSLYPPEVELAKKMPIAPGDTLLLCTDGLWGLLSTEYMGTALGAYPVQFALPQLMDKAEAEGKGTGDNLSAIAVNWLDDDADEPSSISTQTLPDGEVNSNLKEFDAEKVLRETKDVSEADIERAIEEIQAAIKKYSK